MKKKNVCYDQGAGLRLDTGPGVAVLGKVFLLPAIVAMADYNMKAVLIRGTIQKPSEAAIHRD